jgi:lipoprotein-releasing system permease protein
MFKNLPLFIGLRYTRSKRREGFVSFISGFSLFAMALGVMALIVVLSVMNGFDSEIKQRLLRVVPHITGVGPEPVSPAQIAELEQRLLGGESTVAAVVPMVQTYAMLSYQSEQAGVMVQGIDSSWPNAQLVEEHMIAGHLEQLQPGEFGIVLGSQLARQLNTFVGDRLQLTLPEVSISPAGIFPRLKRFVVMGVFTVGAQVDASVALFISRMRESSCVWVTIIRVCSYRCTVPMMLINGC